LLEVRGEADDVCATGVVLTIGVAEVLGVGLSDGLGEAEAKATTDSALAG
jgi:hypothetical protein